MYSQTGFVLFGGDMPRPGNPNVAPSCLVVVVLVLLAGCAGSSSGAPGTAVAPSSSLSASVNITPLSAQLKHSVSLKFAAAAANVTDTSVTWRVGEGAAGGSITDEGVYTAPATDGIYHVVATSKADPSKSATATVSVVTAVFTMTGNLAAARIEHTASLLPSGQVFVAGGMAGPPYTVVSSAEQFDPAKGTFQGAGTVTRSSHTATVLANGDVLLAGGAISFPPNSTTTTGVPTATAELLRAGSGVLQPTGSMGIARYGHTATLLKDGRVLIAGGLVASEKSGAVETQTAELYDPASGTFSPAGNMNAPQWAHTANLLPDGKVLIAGFGEAELYDPATNSFTVTSSVPQKRFFATATTLQDGRVLIASGETYYDIFYTDRSEIYDPATGQFTFTGSLLTARWGHRATLLSDGQVLITGGYNTDLTQSLINSTEIYNPATGAFRYGPLMNVPRAEHTATLLPDGSVLLVSGSTAEIYQ